MLKNTNALPAAAGNGFPPALIYDASWLGSEQVVSLMAHQRRVEQAEVPDAAEPPPQPRRWPLRLTVLFALGVSALLWLGIWFGAALLIDFVGFLTAAR